MAKIGAFLKSDIFVRIYIVGIEALFLFRERGKVDEQIPKNGIGIDR